MENKFTPYPYLSRTPGKQESGIYLVYSSKTACKKVEANSASEALRMSGVEKAVKITRYDPLSMALLDQMKIG